MAVEFGYNNSNINIESGKALASLNEARKNKPNNILNNVIGVGKMVASVKNNLDVMEQREEQAKANDIKQKERDDRKARQAADLAKKVMRQRLTANYDKILYDDKYINADSEGKTSMMNQFLNNSNEEFGEAGMEAARHIAASNYKSLTDDVVEDRHNEVLNAMGPSFTSYLEEDSKIVKFKGKEGEEDTYYKNNEVATLGQLSDNWVKEQSELYPNLTMNQIRNSIALDMEEVANEKISETTSIDELEVLITHQKSFMDGLSTRFSRKKDGKSLSLSSRRSWINAAKKQATLLRGEARNRVALQLSNMSNVFSEDFDDSVNKESFKVFKKDIVDGYNTKNSADNRDSAIKKIKAYEEAIVERKKVNNFETRDLREKQQIPEAELPTLKNRQKLFVKAYQELATADNLKGLKDLILNRPKEENELAAKAITDNFLNGNEEVVDTFFQNMKDIDTRFNGGPAAFRKIIGKDKYTEITTTYELSKINKISYADAHTLYLDNIANSDTAYASEGASEFIKETYSEMTGETLRTFKDLSQQYINLPISDAQKIIKLENAKKYAEANNVEFEDTDGNDLRVNLSLDASIKTLSEYGQKNLMTRINSSMKELYPEREGLSYGFMTKHSVNVYDESTGKLLRTINVKEDYMGSLDDAQKYNQMKGKTEKMVGFKQTASMLVNIPDYRNTKLYQDKTVEERKKIDEEMHGVNTVMYNFSKSYDWLTNKDINSVSIKIDEWREKILSSREHYLGLFTSAESKLEDGQVNRIKHRAKKEAEEVREEKAKKEAIAEAKRIVYEKKLKGGE